MTQFYISLLFCFALFTTHAQKAIVVSGENIATSNYSASYSIGQVSQQSSFTSNRILNQGIQQPFEIFEIPTLSIDNFSDTNIGIKLYPNPTLEFINLSISNAETINASYQLFNLEGKLLTTLKINSLETSINMQRYPAGVYLLNLLDTDSNSLKTFKIIKKQ